MKVYSAIEQINGLLSVILLLYPSAKEKASRMQAKKRKKSGHLSNFPSTEDSDSTPGLYCKYLI